MAIAPRKQTNKQTANKLRYASKECLSAVYLQAQFACARCVELAFKADVFCHFPRILWGFIIFFFPE